ncbi:MAG TPA: sulfite oxidase [Gemmatimonadales bacterium]|nr:sulfite oxidase [Gemmatimonadales bacterium]
MEATTKMMTRRSLLAAGVAGLGGLIACRVGRSDIPASLPEPPEGGLVIRNARPLDAESPLSQLRSFLTPNEHFFVRSHFGPPASFPAEWTLTVDGSVARPVTFTLADLRKLGSTTQVVTTECAGNGRGRLRLPRTAGVQWQYGAISTAEWTGVPLRGLLERAGMTAEAQHLWMEGLDQAPLPAVPKFLRSIPADLGLSHGFLAWEMNGSPIPLLHGGPLRLLTPGWFGMASTKWLTHVHVRPAASDNFFMATAYRLADGSPVERLRVKSLITAPLADERLSVGTVQVQGQAWSGLGAGGIRSVELSLDDGQTWQPARLTGKELPYAWRSFESEVRITSPGPQRLLARATDRSGAVQPRNAEANPGGFANNSMHELRFDAVQA